MIIWYPYLIKWNRWYIATHIKNIIATRSGKFSLQALTSCPSQASWFGIFRNARIFRWNAKNNWMNIVKLYIELKALRLVAIFILINYLLFTSWGLVLTWTFTREISSGASKNRSIKFTQMFSLNVTYYSYFMKCFKVFP